MSPQRERSRKSARTQRQTAAAAEEPIDVGGADDAHPAPRAGAKRTVMDIIRQLPTYLRLLLGLMTDARVAVLDKALVVAAIAYIVSPLDLIPDFVPFLGEVDDVFLLMSALQRLMTNAGSRVVRDHWLGDPADLSETNLRRVLTAAAFFLPRRLRRRLRVIGRR